MTWVVEIFSVQTDKLLADFDVDVLAARAVERLIGDRPEVLTANQVRSVALLFGVEPDRWGSFAESPTGMSWFDTDWLSRALARLVSRTVGQSTEDLVGGVWPVPRAVAQALLDQFSADVVVPEGEVDIGFFA